MARPIVAGFFFSKKKRKSARFDDGYERIRKSETNTLKKPIFEYARMSSGNAKTDSVVTSGVDVRKTDSQLERCGGLTFGLTRHVSDIYLFDGQRPVLIRKRNTDIRNDRFTVTGTITIYVTTLKQVDAASAFDGATE